MQLLVGCTLTPSDIEEIQEGIRRSGGTGRRLRQPHCGQAEDAVGPEESGLSGVDDRSWVLDVKIAIPLDEHGQMKAGLGLYHAKAGVITDDAGDKLVFKGSINETPSGWLNNCESFDVSCSWRGEWDGKKITEKRGRIRQTLGGKGQEREGV